MQPATVTTVSPLTVTLDGSATAVPSLVLGSYAPVVNDRVSIDRQGSQVVIIGGPAPAAGPVAGATMGTPTTTASTGTATAGGAVEIRDSVLGNYTFTAVAGRRYRAVLDGVLIQNTVATDTVEVNIRNGGGSTPITSSTLVAQGRGSGASSFVTVPVSLSFVPGAGPVTLAAFTVRIAGTGVCTPAGPRELYAVDIGPA
jgi:hypothetical protein